MNYFIQIDGETHGPLTEGQIRLRLAERACLESDLIRRENETEWKTIGSVETFRNSFKLGPPLGNPWAVTSFALGLITFLLMTLFFVLNAPWFFISSLLAIICGHIAVYKVRRTAQEVKGYRFAKVGLWIGYLVTFGLPLLVALSVPFFSKTAERGNMTKGISNCRQIITCLRVYASDHNGAYPDNLPAIQTSNNAFRRLFAPDIIEEEKIFGCPESPFKPNGKIGQAPDYLKALEPGENHWAMTAGLNDSMSGSIPIVFENPSEASWPPKWNPAIIGKVKPGRPWAGGRVIVGMNDSSVSPYTLKSLEGDQSELRLTKEGSPVFPPVDGKFRVLNVAQ